MFRTIVLKLVFLLSKLPNVIHKKVEMSITHIVWKVVFIILNRAVPLALLGLHVALNKIVCGPLSPE
jgi:hypothetical protein